MNMFVLAIFTKGSQKSTFRGRLREEVVGMSIREQVCLSEALFASQAFSEPRAALITMAKV